MPSDVTQTHFERLGGQVPLALAVEKFYQRVLQDSQLSKYFATADLSRLKRHQAVFLGQVLGAPESHRGRSLAQAHAGLGITQADFDQVGRHLLAVLTELEVPEDIIDDVQAAIASVASDIVADSSQIRSTESA